MTVTEDCTRAEVIECLALLNAEAKALTRRGYTGTRSQRYADLHGHIDGLLTDLQTMPCA